MLVELRKIIRATQLNAKQLARDTGLTTSQLVVMELLKNEGEMTPRAIAQSMNLTQATVTSLLDRLESRHYLTRERGQRDRRTVHVTLTPDGEAQLASAPESLQQRFVKDFRRLESWEQTSILAALQRVSHLLDAASIDAAPVLDVGHLADHEGREG
ncbi:MAG TPA: MarR family transcriptional regulator [Steroidobacteraceae bacterium]|nr:MarR family transcriptional regulator [Steroidobacteraceae bacterium]